MYNNNSPNACKDQGMQLEIIANDFTTGCLSDSQSLSGSLF